MFHLAEEACSRLKYINHYGTINEKLKKAGGKYMTQKENLVFELKNLLKEIKKSLKVLEKGEIDETAYMMLNSYIFSVQQALRYYFDEDYFKKPKEIIMLIPYKE